MPRSPLLEQSPRSGGWCCCLQGRRALTLTEITVRGAKLSPKLPGYLVHIRLKVCFQVYCNDRPKRCYFRRRPSQTLEGKFLVGDENYRAQAREVALAPGPLLFETNAPQV